MIRQGQPPRATYRLQFHKNFTFRHATDIASYIATLGISHVYASPIFRAAPGSTHGYDICDHNSLNPELGTKEDFETMTRCFRELGLGLVLDFVPNHMNVSDPLNQWWRDVLEHGPASRFAAFFDIEWQPVKPSMLNRVLLPVLPDQYGQVLASGGLRLVFEEGGFELVSPGGPLPLCPRSTRVLLEHAAGLVADAPPELLSIRTALEHLPARDCTEPFQKEERHRESLICRKRLTDLSRENPEVLAALKNTALSWGPHGGIDGLDRLDRLLSEQAYRLSYWRVAGEEINYRRFFDVDSLAAIRMELPEVFEATHGLLLSLVETGQVQGVRIDHIDGLARPVEYLVELRQRLRARTATACHIPIYVEKILAPEERLPLHWPVDGTTGYEFANAACRLLADPAGEPVLTRCYHRFIQETRVSDEVIIEAKKLIMDTSLSGEINMLGVMLSRLADSHRDFRDFTLNALTHAIREVIASFPVYRTYLAPETPAGEEDNKIISQAINAARRNNPASERSVFGFLRKILLPSFGEIAGVDEELRRAFVLKFQQCSSPVAAKGVEDTALYSYTRFLALNEVGGDPRRFAMPAGQFHKRCIDSQQEFPDTLLATSTHDTKRSEDVRARLVALSELASSWGSKVVRWKAVNAKHKTMIDGRTAPDSNEEYLIYQTLVGTWPLEEPDQEAEQAYLARIKEYILKACREAKINSSWISPNEAWEKANGEFVDRIFSPLSKNRFKAQFIPFAHEVQQVGAVNSLAQLVLKLTIPGVPDFYQGTELWDLSLVDPDNRRPVNYDLRQQMLAGTETAPAMTKDDWKSGRIKLGIIRTLLNLRKKLPRLFSDGPYSPVRVEGGFSECCVAFERQSESHRLLVIVPRLSSRVGFPPIGESWAETSIHGGSGTRWQNVLTLEQGEGNIPSSVSALLKVLPVGAFLQEINE